MKRNGFLFALALMAGSCFANADWSSNNSNLVVGFAAGGTTDIIARSLAQDFSAETGKNFIVVNKPGANSGIAIASVLNSPSDGGSILLVPVGLALNEFMYDDIKYGINDFSSIGLIAKMPNVILINKNKNISNLKELIDYIKENPESISFAANAAGSSAHLSAVMLESMSGAKMLHVPFNGDAPSLNALMSNVVDVAIINLSSAASLIESGNFIPLALTTNQRSEKFSNIPTISELGYPEYDVSSYFGLAVKKGTPDAIIKNLNTLLNQSIENKAFSEKMLKMGFILEKGSPEDFDQFLRNESTKWKDVLNRFKATEASK